MLPSRLKNLKRRLAHSERYPTLQFLFFIGLALIHLPPIGWSAYLAAKRLQRRGATAPISIRIGKGRTIFLRDTDTDLGIFEQVILLGDCKLPWRVRDLRFIIDAGAHIGSASLFYAANYPQARILAVEADAGNFAQLVKNTAGHPSITPMHAAVFHQSADVVIAIPVIAPGAFKSKPQIRTTQTPTRSSTDAPWPSS